MIFNNSGGTSEYKVETGIIVGDSSNTITIPTKLKEITAFIIATESSSTSYQFIQNVIYPQYNKAYVYDGTTTNATFLINNNQLIITATNSDYHFFKFGDKTEYRYYIIGKQGAELPERSNMLFNNSGGGNNSNVGIVFDEMYDDIYPSKVTINYKGVDIPSGVYALASYNTYGKTFPIFSYTSYVEIKCKSIRGMNGFLQSLGIKLSSSVVSKVKLIGVETLNDSTSYYALGNIGYGHTNKIYIPNSVTSILTGMAFTNNSGYTNTQLFCEASSKPDRWNSNWNSDNCPVTWGVTEAAFDAMQKGR